MFRKSTRTKRTFETNQPELHWTAERNAKEAQEFQRVCLPDESQYGMMIPEIPRLANRQEKIIFDMHKK